jgi:SEC-C motif-containing protein
MRSRYSAFVSRDEQYLLATWHPSRRPRQITFAPDQTWLGLTIVEMQVTGADSAEVEFIARSRFGPSAEMRHHERSRFVREHGVWLYVEGALTE